MTSERCGYTIIDKDGIEQPCDRPGTLWRWYQNHAEHEDALDVACTLHENEGGRRIAAVEAERDALRAAIQAVEQRLNELGTWAENELITDDGFARACVFSTLRDIRGALAAAGVDRENMSSDTDWCCPSCGKPVSEVCVHLRRLLAAIDAEPVGDTGQADEPQQPCPCPNRGTGGHGCGNSAADDGGVCSWCEEYCPALPDAPAGQVVPQQPTAQRWAVDLTCCGEDAGVQITDSWDRAQAFRESYLDVEGHERTAVIHHAIDAARIGYQSPRGRAAERLWRVWARLPGVDTSVKGHRKLATAEEHDEIDDYAWRSAHEATRVLEDPDRRVREACGCDRCWALESSGDTTGGDGE